MTRNPTQMKTNVSNYVLAFIAFSMHNFIVYTQIKGSFNLRSKQKAYILSIQSSFTLFGMSLLMAYNFLTNPNYLNAATETQKLMLIYFSSYLFSDILIGANQYRKHMMTLSGYFHHGVYLFLNVLAFHWPYTIPMYTLFFTEELPTFLLGIGSFHSSFRHDELFGLTFFSTRIVLHFVYICLFWHAVPVRITALLAFVLHSFWFYKWTVSMKRKVKNLKFL